ncbi:MAG: DUF6288 domain-containing protein, partial [Verrucomicrobiota bacterium]
MKQKRTLCLAAIVAAGLGFSLFARAQMIDSVLKVNSTYGPFQIGVTGIEAAFQPVSTQHQLVVSSTFSGTPADGLFLVNDVIQSVNGQAVTGALPRIILGKALTGAEATDGMMDFGIERGGMPTNIVLHIPVLGAYSTNWPMSCPKSDAIVLAAANYYAGSGISGANPVDEAFQALFLLSTGETQHLDAVRTHAQGIGGGASGRVSNWGIGYNGIVLGEYFLRTGDTTVLPALQTICDKLVEQTIAGTWAHHGDVSLGYGDGGQLNAAGVAALATLVLARESGIDIDTNAFVQAVSFFYRFAGRGGVSYGSYQPDVNILNGNGKNATLACLMSVLGASDPRFTDAAEAMALQVVHAYPAWDSGHTGNGLRVGWEALAISLLPGSKNYLYRQHNDAMSWYYDLCRHPLGGFQKVPGNGSDQYDARSWGAVAGLIYTAPRKNLRLCGGAPTAHSVLTPVPALPWGNPNDEDMFGIDPLPEYGPDDISIDVLRIENKNPGAHGAAYFERWLYHATQIYRYNGARRLAEKADEGDNTALTALLNALQHSELRVRRAAMHGFSLGEVDAGVVSTQALPLVEHVLTNSAAAWWELHGVLGMLAECDPSAIAPHRERLRALSNHSDDWMRQQVAAAIGALGAGAE